jgi:hypothetical protein
VNRAARLLFLLLAAGLTSGLASPPAPPTLAEPAPFRADIAAEGASHFVHRPTDLAITLSGASSPELGELPEIPGAAVIGSGPAEALPAAAGGTPAHRIVVQIVPGRPGPLAIPPLPVHDGGRLAFTPALRIAVGAPREAGEMDLALTLDKGAIRVDEAATLTVRWTVRCPLERCQALGVDIPLLRNPALAVFPVLSDVPEADRIGLPVGGQRAIGRIERGENGEAAITVAYRLVGRSPAAVAGGQARISCELVLPGRASPAKYPSYFDNHFFTLPGKEVPREEVYLVRPSPGIAVKALPAEGRSSLYAGIAGPCAVSARVEPASAVVGQAILFAVTLEGLECPEAVGPLPEAALRALDADFHRASTPWRESADASGRTFVYVLRPLRAGIASIPAIALQRFDPAAGRYETVRSRPVPIRVAPDGEKRVYLPTRGEIAPLVARDGIRQNRGHEPVLTTFCAILDGLAASAGWVLWLPPLAWLALRPLAKRLERCRRDPAYARALGAGRAFRRSFRADPARAWRTFLADRLGLDAAAITGGTVGDALRRRGVEEDLVAEVERSFAESDRAEFAKRGGGGETRDFRPLVARIVRSAVPAAMLLAGLITAAEAGAAVPDDAFAAAMAMRAEKPDEALPLFVEAGLGFEEESAYLDAGNSWWFAGQPGRALANYRAAERRAPFDRQVRESVAAILAARGAADVAGSSGGGFLASGWERFCRWSPRLRLGLVMAVYLAGWAIFFVARLSGRRIPGFLWALLVLAAAGPMASLAATFREPPRGVLLQPGEARLGPGYAYGPAFDRALPEAAEFVVRERRGDWSRIALPGGREAWILASDAAVIP